MILSLSPPERVRQPRRWAVLDIGSSRQGPWKCSTLIKQLRHSTACRTRRVARHFRSSHTYTYTSEVCCRETDACHCGISISGPGGVLTAGLRLCRACACALRLRGPGGGAFGEHSFGVGGLEHQEHPPFAGWLAGWGIGGL